MNHLLCPGGLLNKFSHCIRHAYSIQNCFSAGLKISFFFVVVLLAASCKTCNCPAYSYDRYSNKPEQATVLLQEPEVINNFKTPPVYAVVQNIR